LFVLRAKKDVILLIARRLAGLLLSSRDFRFSFDLDAAATCGDGRGGGSFNLTAPAYDDAVVRILDDDDDAFELLILL
jgi:hypothetical protein